MTNPSQRLEVRDHREKDWFWSNNGVIEWYGEIIGADSVAVYMVLAKHANLSGESWPSYDTIAKKLKLSRPTVIKCMKKLEACGLVAKTLREQPTKEGGKMPDSNMYVLLTVRLVDEPSKARLLGLVKEIDHPTKKASLRHQDAKIHKVTEMRPSKGDLPGVVKELYPPSKGALPKQDSLNKTQLNKREREENHSHSLAPAVQLYFETYPSETLSAKQIQAITAAVSDLVRWRQVLDEWALNGWNPKGIGKMLDRYSSGRTVKDERPAANGHKPADSRPPLPAEPIKPRTQLSPDRMKTVIDEIEKQRNAKL